MPPPRFHVLQRVEVGHDRPSPSICNASIRTCLLEEHWSYERLPTRLATRAVLTRVDAEQDSGPPVIAHELDDGLAGRPGSAAARRWPPSSAKRWVSNSHTC